jgi:hypothetical protein
MAQDYDRLCTQQNGKGDRQAVRTATWHKKTTGCAHSNMAHENDRLCAQQNGTGKRQAVRTATWHKKTTGCAQRNGARGRQNRKATENKVIDGELTKLL